MLDIVIVSQQIELVRVKKKCVLRGYTVFINVNWAKMHIVKEKHPTLICTIEAAASNFSMLFHSCHLLLNIHKKAY